MTTVRQLPEILSVETIAKTRIFEVQAVDLRFSNGEERRFERLTPQRRSSVMVIPIQDQYLIFVKEYAVGSERYELGFPKGIVDPGEEPIVSANRELQEEIGFGAKRIEFLRSLYSGPSHMFGLMHLFIAQDLYPSKLAGDEPEPLEIVRIPLADIDELLADPNFAESRNLSALFMLRDYLASGRK
ncbi:ADP compounds hydrolase NudE [Actinobacillus pleuropneumoniae]|uniref:Putative ADP compounds hydrolase n=1 Tax=Actinobacillus pleuropneumoniae serotype 5b (strain L20) TaxID=416269 RepID=A3N1W1_ACTP2|nr:ADP compounds hydrolase NudE [Actinobacillus pleuropneumoniae]ABN74397.1 putative ADP compounds hydrolase [Actinobacillus pleuropneumoniae serovar 5b str. L20]KIE89913.1 putative ADP-ribose diphosphatase NudE [Actinobacillus pleuropneumoniae]KIE90019.1 putative ADP-ribose diphosphatase NudE [Actinobacillus pleuropneumoniae]KIE90116.1 putative ADP-ribose diphosphatase NudE [Actinobacillus pleuropneumoniae]KIE95963.1 putative ADP-ribose diphosphatase NudE [Actinobacillus pleuropneumoniae]